MDDITCARIAATAWGDLAAPPRPVRTSGSALFEARFSDGRHLALRLHRSEDHLPAAIEARQRLTEALADTGFACPWPHRTTTGSLIYPSEAGGPIVTAEQWLSIDPPPPVGASLEDPPADQIAFIRATGALLADLHLTADAIAPLDAAQVRPAWNRSALCDPAVPGWGAFWQIPALDPNQSKIMRRAHEHATRQLLQIPPQETGLIHANCVPAKFLASKNQLYLVDFDNCGIGYRLYDLATVLFLRQDDPLFDTLIGSLLAGYRDAEGPLPDTAVNGLPLFMMLRAITLAGRLIHRTPSEDHNHMINTDGIVRLATAFLQSC